jgi:hypothetical protein
VASLPNTDEMTADAVKAEEVLAELEANAELAGSVGSIGATGMTDEEQALFEELEKETGGGAAATPASTSAESSRSTAVPKSGEVARETVKEPMSASPRRNEPEPG